MASAHATSTISGAFLRALAGLSLVEACSIAQGAFGARVDAGEEHRARESARGARPSSDDDGAGVADEGGVAAARTCSTCSAAPFVLKQVDALYLAGRADRAAMASDVAFEDPVALCEGIDEVREAFRALRWFRPERAAPSTVERIAANRYVVRTATRYAAPFDLGAFVVRSDVIVDTRAEERGNNEADGTRASEETGKIRRVEERWNGALLLEGFPFDMVRRSVGLCSYACTSRIPSPPSDEPP